MDIKVSIVEQKIEYNIGTLSNDLVITLEIEEGLTYNGEDKDIDRVVFVVKPKVLAPIRRVNTEWK